MQFIHTHSVPIACRVLLLVFVVVACVLALRWQGAGAQGGDDHGNYLNTATPISLGSSIAGRIGSGDDLDVFRLTVQRFTDVWIYTTGDLDSLGGLYDSSGELLIGNDDGGILGREHNFSIRYALNGTYYIGVYSSDGVTTGDYILHVESVTDPGSTPATGKLISLDSPAGGLIWPITDSDYFRLELTEPRHLYLYGMSVYGQAIFGGEVNSQNQYVGRNQFQDANSFEIRDEFGPGTHYIQVITDHERTQYPVPYIIHAVEDVWYTDFLKNCADATRQLNSPLVRDSLYGCQWHLNNTSGQDINVDGVWAEGINGQGINIAVVDDGMYFDHEDLRENVNAALNHDYTTFGSISHPLEHHGTYVTGVIAARDNDIGVRGVAPRATVYGYNLRGNHTDENTGHALTLNRGITAVSNNSWGKPGSPGFRTVPQIFTLAFNEGIDNGYGGLGTFYVFAAGNGHRAHSNANLSELITHHGVTAVCAVNDGDDRASYSEVGANLWICAPSGEGRLPEHREIVTLENYDRYYYSASGTSMAAPIVSGVAALMREVRPDLTWRDLKLILASTARKNNPTNSGWLVGAPKYRSEQDTDTYHFNHWYGFGVVDAQAAVDLARGWQTLPPMLTSSVDSGPLNGRLPDAPLLGTPSTVYHQLTLDTDVEFTEFVEVNITVNHPSFRDLSITLVSPSGAVSVLALPWDTFTPDDPDDIDFYPLNGSFRLGSARHLGEDPNGTWTLYLTDNFHGGTGVLASWNLTVYGHAQPDVEPQVEVNFTQSTYTVTEGDSVDVIVSLDADPQRTVTVPIIATSQGGATAADYSGISESVTFANGGPTSQTISFTATDDQIEDPNESVKLSFGALPDRVLLGTTAETTVAITDNDIAGVTVEPTSLTILEGATSTYTVKLNTQPQEAVTVAVLSSDNPDVNASPTTLSFNSLTWSTPQTVTVTADHDADTQNDSATVTHTVNRYGSITTADSVTVTVTDDDGIPTVRMSLTGSPQVRLRVGIPVSVMFDQPVSDFGVDDLTVTNGHAEGFAGETPGTNYSFDVVPTAIGVVAVDITAGAAQNSAGQESVAAEQLQVGLPYDDDRDDIIGGIEVLNAVRDFFTGLITGGEVLNVVRLYFSGG